MTRVINVSNDSLKVLVNIWWTAVNFTRTDFLELEVHYRSVISSEKNIIILDFHVLTQLFSIKNIKYPEKNSPLHWIQQSTWMTRSC